MPEIKLISPLLDDFIIGDVFSEHNGVCCVPAMKNNSDTRYIVKVISIPASQVQVDAFLQAGIYQTTEAAKGYFAQQAADVEIELGILSKLSALEGFLNYEGYQIVEKEDEIGFDVYLLATYKHSLERQFRKYPMTHLGAVNLGLDICAALSVARQAGYMVADLKPSNIFIGEDNAYRIGDIGFLPTNSLRFATLHDRYRSVYTAPEIQDPLAPISDSLDIFAAGLILYQAYNGGALPVIEDTQNQQLQPPLYADYEMSEIILKACSLDPQARWQSPIEMGQEIVSYMQRNGANDTPIAPPIVRDEPVEEAVTVPPSPEEEIELPTYEEDEMQITTDDLLAIVDGSLAAETTADETDESSSEELPQEDVSAELTETEDAAPEEEITEQNFMDGIVNDETAPDEETAPEVTYSEISEDANDILLQADDLIAHETPAPMTVPEEAASETEEAIETAEETAEEAAEATEDTTGTNDELSQTVAAISLVVEASDNSIETQIDSGIELEEENTETEPEEELVPEISEEEEEPSEEYVQKPKSNWGIKLLIGFLITVIVACIAVGGFLFYRNYYMKTVDKLTVSGEGDKLTVTVLSDADPDLLSVVCTDTYGNKQTAPLLSGTATFTDLAPDAMYRLSISISGFHGLRGETKTTYTTAPRAEIMSFTSITGAEVGTVILNFTVKGYDAQNWIISYSAPGEQERTQNITGHSATITGLTPDATYTFELNTEDNVFVTGQNKLEYTVCELVYPENVTIAEFSDSAITVEWTTPESVEVPQWTVMCYNENGYNQNVTTSENKAVFEGTSRHESYTIEVTAAGMSVGEHFFLSKNTVIAKDFTVALDGQGLNVSWGFDGNTPNSKWLLTYRFENEETETAVATEGTTARVENIVPRGNYTFTLRLEDGTTVLKDVQTVKVSDAEKFKGLGTSADKISFAMCLAPKEGNWIWWEVKTRKSDFTVGELAGFVVHVKGGFKFVADPLNILLVVRNKDGSFHSLSRISETWNKMWKDARGEINLANIPTAPGEYTVEIYFNGGFVHEQSFTVAEKTE